MTADEPQKGKSIDIGVIVTWFSKNWKTFSGVFSVLGLFVFIGFSISGAMSELRYKHNEVVRDVEVLKSNAEKMQMELRGVRESSIRQEVILERIERKLP